MRTTTAASLATIFLLAACDRNPAATPAPRDDAPWRDMHAHLRRHSSKSGAKLVFLGDSITQAWAGNETWRRYYGPRGAVNLGIGGERTEELLWRLDHGALDGIEPRVVVLLIGTNNLADHTDEEVAGGVEAVVGRVRRLAPRARVLLLGIFPRGAVRGLDAASQVVWPRIEAANRLIRRLDDGGKIRVLDVGPALLDPDGTISREVMPDFLHLSPRGYRLWAEAMEPMLRSLLKDSPTPSSGPRLIVP